MAIGFIGLGNLGRAMAARLAAQGIEVVVWNRTAEKKRAFVNEFGKNGKVIGVDSPREVAERAQVVFLNLFDSKAVKDVLSRSEGLLAEECKRKVVVDTTTNHFRTVLEFHDLAAKAGATYLEAPVLGSVVPASQGALSMLVSGAQRPFEEVRPQLDLLAKTIIYLGEPALATKMKLINNLVLGSFMATIAEGVSLAEVSGLPREKALEILASGAGNSAVLNAKRQKLIDFDFSPHFSVSAIHKDLRYLAAMVQAFGRDGEMSGAAERLFKIAEERGLGSMDLSAVYQIFKK
jgi:3-hydroxyisobutyrate dehydrogenase